MNEIPSSGFYARFLGGFSLFYEKEKIIIPKRTRQKSMQLLIMLLMAGKKGIPRKRLAQMLEGELGRLDNQMNCVRYHSYALRRLIDETKGFPEGKYVVISKGIYYFSLIYETETDIGRIDELYQKIQSKTLLKGEERTNTLLAICRLYTGELLPSLVGEEWVMVKSADYQFIYFQCLKELCGILEKQKNYSLLLELSTIASKLYPFDGWQAVQIDCLMAQNRCKEAMQIYKKASMEFYEELGVSLLGQRLMQYQNAGEESSVLIKNFEKIKENLNEKNQKREAYACSYPSFIDLCRIISRIKEGSNSSVTLLVCTLKDREGKIPNDKAYTAQQMEKFRQKAAESIEINDVYTLYSPNQLAILLIEADIKKGRAVAEQLKAKWEDKSGESVWVEFALGELGEGRQYDGKKE